MVNTFFSNWYAIRKNNDFEFITVDCIKNSPDFEYEHLLYTVEQAAEVANKTKKTIVPEIMFPSLLTVGKGSYKELDSIKKYLVKNIKKKVNYIQVVDDKKEICIYKKVNIFLYKYFSIKFIQRLNSFLI